MQTTGIGLGAPVRQFAGMTRLGSEHGDSLLIELTEGLGRGSLAAE